MRILLLLSESWNDQAAPNNNMSNWFTGFPDAEIWTISGSSFPPSNNCCKHYFLIGEVEMLRSIFSSQCAGTAFELESDSHRTQSVKKDISEDPRFKRRFSVELARLCRDLVWRYGRYNLDALKEFIQRCDPDIVFSQRMGSVKMCRLEQTVASITNAPMVAYTGDDEYSLQHFSLDPVFWIRRIWVRAWLRKRIPNYKLFYCQSKRQIEEFHRLFSVPTKFLVKCGAFDSSKIHSSVSQPIKMVYAGKLYCGRWKTLSMIADEVEQINLHAGKDVFQLRIYTADHLSGKQKNLLDRSKAVSVCPPVTAKELAAIYSVSDIVLHVEGFGLKQRLATKDSFSTKVIDCLACGCAVMAVCWSGHAAFQYLRERDAAITAASADELHERMEALANNPKLVTEYADKAYRCGAHYHERANIQAMIYQDFQRIIEA